MSKKVWIELIEPWGEYRPGDVAEFDSVKANPLIAAGTAKKAKGPRKRDKLRVETATAPPAAETADAPPSPAKTGPDLTQTKTASGDVTSTGPGIGHTANGNTTETGNDTDKQVGKTQK